MKVFGKEMMGGCVWVESKAYGAEGVDRVREGGEIEEEEKKVEVEGFVVKPGLGMSSLEIDLRF